LEAAFEDGLDGCPSLWHPILGEEASKDTVGSGMTKLFVDVQDNQTSEGGMTGEEDGECHRFILTIDQPCFDAEDAIGVEDYGMRNLGREMTFLVHFDEGNPRFSVVARGEISFCADPSGLRAEAADESEDIEEDLEKGNEGGEPMNVNPWLYWFRDGMGSES
jgi:hypothetical protein